MTRIDLARASDVGGIESGTAFPGTPSTNDLFHRTDRDLIYFYDGTRWLTTTLFSLEIQPRVTQGQSGYTVSSTIGNAPMPNTDIFVEKLRVVAFTASAFNGTDRWTVSVEKRTPANSGTVIGVVDINSTSAGTWSVWEDTIDEVVAISTHTVFQIFATRFNSGGALILSLTVPYRLVG